MPVIINGSTGISGTDGTAATPAVQGTDTNTGMFFPAADQIAFSEGGTEVMRIDASGNVGIGTTTPGAKLDVNGWAQVVTNASAGFSEESRKKMSEAAKARCQREKARALVAAGELTIAPAE